MITLINSRVVKADREDSFRAWAEQVAAHLARQPGFAGGLCIEQSGGIHHLIQRFESEDALRAWQRTVACQGLTDAAADFSTPRQEVVEGLLPSVQLPGEADAPKWKRFLMTLAAAMPVAIAVSLFFAWLGDPLPAAGQAALSATILVATMTYLILPRLSRWLAPWVMMDEDGRARVS